MKKKAAIFFGVLIYFTTIIGCNAIDSNTNISKEFSGNAENIMNILISDYNGKQGTEIEKDKLSIYSIKPYKKGFLLLVCYKNAVPELKLIYLTKGIDGYHILKYAEGLYDINKLVVNKVQEENNAIYFGSLDNSSMQQGGIGILLDNGESFDEKIHRSQKGYIIIANKKTMIVDFYSYNLKEEKNYFIKNFVNYSNGVNESKWKD